MPAEIKWQPSAATIARWEIDARQFAAYHEAEEQRRAELAAEAKKKARPSWWQPIVGAGYSDPAEAYIHNVGEQNDLRGSSWWLKQMKAKR